MVDSRFSGVQRAAIVPKPKAKGAVRHYHRDWYGPRSPLVCPELREDLLDSLYALNGVAFDLDLQWPNLDEAWPMFSE